jgi:hypothetical protein
MGFQVRIVPSRAWDWEKAKVSISDLLTRKRRNVDRRFWFTIVFILGYLALLVQSRVVWTGFDVHCLLIYTLTVVRVVTPYSQNLSLDSSFDPHTQLQPKRKKASIRLGTSHGPRRISRFAIRRFVHPFSPRLDWL